MLSGGPRGRCSFGEEEPVRAPGGKQATAGYCTWLGAQPTVYRSDLGTEGDPLHSPALLLILKQI